MGGWGHGATVVTNWESRTKADKLGVQSQGFKAEGTGRKKAEAAVWEKVESEKTGNKGLWNRPRIRKDWS